MYVKGQWKAVCDRCGNEYLARQLKLEWNGLRTCCGPGTVDCWEARHPQDFVKGKSDRQAPPWTRPEPADVFVSTWILSNGTWSDDGSWNDAAYWNDGR